MKDEKICKLMSNKHEKIFVYVYWNGIDVPVWTCSGWMNKIQWMADHKSEDFVKKEMIY